MVWEEKGLEDSLNDILGKLNSLNAIDPATSKALFKKVDIWNDQLDFESTDATGYSVANPAIFVEMRPADEIQLGMGINLITYEVILHIISVKLHKKNFLDRNEEIFTFRNLVKKGINYYQPAQMGRLV